MAVLGSSYRDRDRIAAHVKRRRRRLLEHGVDDYRLEAVRGVGYRLVPTALPSVDPETAPPVSTSAVPG